MDDRSEEIARAHAAVAEAQDRSYWLDRWHLDLNALMRRRGASELRAAIRVARAVYRALYNTGDRLRRARRTLPRRAAAARQVLAEEERQGASVSSTSGAGSSSRLKAGAVSQRLGKRVNGDDPRALVALQRADILVSALDRTGAEPEAGQEWLGLGESADAVLRLLEDAFPGLRPRLDGAGNGAVDVAFALSDWTSGTGALGQVDDLRDAVRPGGHLILTAPAPARSDDQPVTPQALLAHCTPAWRITLYVPGGMEGDRDLYVLERA